MQTDRELLDRARRLYTDHRVDANTRAELQRLADNYDVCCLLSRGSDAKRAAHWNGKALLAQAKLREEVKSLEEIRRNKAA